MNRGFRSIASFLFGCGILAAPVVSFGQVVTPNTFIIARAPGRVGKATINVKSTSGAGGTAAHARAGGNQKAAGDSEDPAAGGSSFDDTTNIGPANAPVKALTQKQTVLIGRSLGNGYSGIPSIRDVDALSAGRSVLYNVDAHVDKVADAKAAANKMLTMTSTAGKVTVSTTDSNAAATQTVTVNADNKSVSAVGKAETTIERDLFNPFTNMKIPPERAFAAAAVHDPITYEVDTPGIDGSVDVSLGDSQNPLFLQVTDPAGFADAFYELDVNDSPLLIFDFALNFTTGSLNQALRVDFIDPALGSETDFRTLMGNNLTFDGTNHTISTDHGIPLDTVPVTDRTGPQTITFLYGATVAADVPEPSGAIAMVLGAAGMLALVVGRRRKAGM